MKITKANVHFYAICWLLFYSTVYFWFPYKFEWIASDQPSAPVYILISRDVLFLAVLFFLIAFPDRSSVWNKKILREYFCIYAMFIAFSIPSVLRLDFGEYLQHFLRNVSMYLLFPPFFAVVFTRKNVAEFLIYFFVLSGFVQALFGLLVWYSEPFQNSLWGGGRVFSLMGNPNTLGLFLAMANTILLLLFSFRRDVGERSWVLKRSIIAAFFVLNCLVLLLTLSVQAILSQIVMISIAMIYVARGRNTIIASGIGFIVVAAILVAATQLEEFVKLLIFRFESPDSTSVYGRIEQFEKLVLVLSDPFSWLSGWIAGEEYLLFDGQYHNLIVNHGILVFLMYLVLLIFPIVRSYRSVKKMLDNRQESVFMKALAVGSVAFLVSLIFVSNLTTAFAQRYPINLYVSVLLGFLISLVVREGKFSSWKNASFAGSGHSVSKYFVSEVR